MKVLERAWRWDKYATGKRATTVNRVAYARQKPKPTASCLYARRTDYYDLAAARRWLALRPLADRLRRDGILARLDEAVESVAGAETSHADRTRAVDAALADLAADAGCHADDLATIYWGTWDDEE